MRTLSPNARGSIYMVLGSLGYVVNDAFVRRATETGPDVYQVLCLRSIGIAAVFAFVGKMHVSERRRGIRQRSLLLRVGAEMAGSALFFAALIRLEFANAQAILQVVPFAVTLAAAIWLKERVDVRQYVAILIGFVGVVIVIRPATEGFSAWSLAAVGTATLMVVREFATRGVDPHTPAPTIAFATATGLGLLTAVLSPPHQWVALPSEAVGSLIVSIVSLVIGYHFTIQTVRVGDLSVSAPFRYSILVGAVVMGFVLFGEVPDRFTVAGSLIIVATGIYAVRFERTRPARWLGPRSSAAGVPNH